jgi:RNA polymerase sigma-70 factor (ECF subfamily)
VKRNRIKPLTTGWLITVARNKLVDHWRRESREERGMRLASGGVSVTEDADWAEQLDEPRALAVLAHLGPHHRIALSLKYLDDLTVPRIAEQLGRTEHATEALLVRARSAFRKAYGERSDDAS